MSEPRPLDRARAEVSTARQAARAARAAFAESAASAFVHTMRQVMQQYLGMRGQGVSREDACRGLEAELRDAWPKATSRFAPTCEACEDTGWQEHTCWAEHRCGRARCVRQHPAWEHAYVVACQCAKGGTHRTRIAAVEDVIAAAGRTRNKKSGGWRRLGS